MTAQLAPLPQWRNWDNNGNPLFNGLLYTYAAGTTTLQASYTDSTQSTPHSNPVILNARGESSVWLDPTLTYKLVLTDQFGNQLWSQDQIPGGFLPFSQFTAAIIAGLLDSFTTAPILASYNRTAAEIAAGVTPTNYAYPEGYVQRYGSVGTTDDGPVIQKAFNVIAGTLNGRVVLAPITHQIQTPLTITTQCIVQGQGRRVTTLKWTQTGVPGQQVMLTINAPGTDANTVLQDFGIDNSGTATIGILIKGVRVVCQRIFSNTTVGFSQYLLSTDPAATIYNFVLRDCQFGGGSLSGCCPTLVNMARGHTLVIDHCMFSWFLNSAVIFGDGTNSVQGAFVSNTRFESFSGSGANAGIGIDALTVSGLSVKGCSWEMSSDQNGASAAQRAIRLTTVSGGAIHGNYLAGDGVCTALINVANSAATGIHIAGNTFVRVNGYGVEATGSGTFANIEFGINDAPNPTTGVWNDTTVTVAGTVLPTISFGGGSTGVTYGSQKLNWRRVGTWIEFHAIVRLTNKGSSTGSVLITLTGLPNSLSGPDLYACAIRTFSLTGITGGVQASVTNGANTVEIAYSGTGANTALADTNCNNTAEFHVTGRYKVAV